MTNSAKVRHTFILLCFLSFCSFLSASDWPCWGYDISRLGASPGAKELPERMSLYWKRELPAANRAWLSQKDDKDKLEFDLSYSPIAANNKLFIASMTEDTIIAYDAENGEELWRFYANGPIRVAPTFWQNKLYAVSDDGHLYCVDSETGNKLWSFFAAPDSHLALGNRRLISMWPSRSAPVVDDGKVYFATGIWPFLGTCIYSLDANDGSVIWANTGHSTQWQAQPHGGAFAFSGLAPQGYIAKSADVLIVAGGRSPPALFNALDGELIYFNAQAKPHGGYQVMHDGKYFYNHGRRHRISTGIASGSGAPEHEYISALQEQVEKIKPMLAEGEEVYNSIVAFNRLFISTKQGNIYCFGRELRRMPFRYSKSNEKLPEPSDKDVELAKKLIQESPRPRGWALISEGASDGLIDAILQNSELNCIVLENDKTQLRQKRDKYSAAGIYGERITVLPGKLADLKYPEYVSTLVIVPDPKAAGFKTNTADLEKIYKLVKPYTGRAWVNFPAKEIRKSIPKRFFASITKIFKKDSQQADHRLADFQPEDGKLDLYLPGGGVLLSRTKALPGAGEWTHQHANPAQSVISQDTRVRLPLAPIWFGTVTNDYVLPRHHSGPRPQVAGGVLCILGVETISARCVYTGQILWVKDFPGIGHPFTSLELEKKWDAGESVYMINDPGTTYIGSPYVTMADGIYLRYKSEVYRLNPCDGKVLGKWALPSLTKDEQENDPPDWGHISVQGKYLIATVDPYIFMDGKLGKLANGWDGSASRRIVVLDRYTGEVLWHRDADIGFRHNAICSTKGILYVNDLLSAKALDMALRRGLPIKERPKLYALDLSNGKEIWSQESDVFGTFLSYSEEYDILLEGGTRDGRRHLEDEPSDRLQARSGKDGNVLWVRSESYSGPLILHDDKIISGRPGSAINIITGKPKTRLHPLTGDEMPWRYWKSYGCGSSNACPNLLLFRSGAAGFTDLENDGGTGNLGGFKSGCTSSMIPADGILNAPDYTRTCTCSYQNQTSLAFVHKPEMELWTSNQPIINTEGKIRQIGFNLGAPGDRRDENGTLWLHVPNLAPSPLIPLLMECEDLPEGIRIVSATGGTDPEKAIDQDFDHGWRINDRSRGTFSASEALVLSLNEEITLDNVEIAWSGPKETEFEFQALQDGKWKTLFHNKEPGKGKDLLNYTFDKCSTNSWRVLFTKHGDESLDSRKRRRLQTVTIFEMKLGSLPKSAYAFYAPKEYWRKHSLLTKAPQEYRWIAASGVKNIYKLVIPAVFEADASYELNMILAEPDKVAKGERVFDIIVQGEVKAKDVDIFALSDTEKQGQKLTFTALNLENGLEIEFRPKNGSKYSPVLCGLEVRPER